MIARICSDGSFEVKRKGEWKSQHCPFYWQIVDCGDWCPLFTEYFSINISEKYVTLWCSNMADSILVVEDNRKPKEKGYDET